MPAVARALERAETRPWGANVDTATAETLILTVRSCDASAEQVLFKGPCASALRNSKPLQSKKRAMSRTRSIHRSTPMRTRRDAGPARASARPSADATSTRPAVKVAAPKNRQIRLQGSAHGLFQKCTFGR